MSLYSQTKIIHYILFLLKCWFQRKIVRSHESWNRWTLNDRLKSGHYRQKAPIQTLYLTEREVVEMTGITLSVCTMGMWDIDENRIGKCFAALIVHIVIERCCTPLRLYCTTQCCSIVLTSTKHSRILL